MFPPRKEEVRTKFVSIEVIEGTYKDIFINVFENNGDITNPFTIPKDIGECSVKCGFIFAGDGMSLDTGEQTVVDGEIEDGAVKVSITPEMTIGKAIGAFDVRLFEDSDKPVSILIGDIRVVKSRTPQIFD